MSRQEHADNVGLLLHKERVKTEANVFSFIMKMSAYGTGEHIIIFRFHFL